MFSSAAAFLCVSGTGFLKANSSWYVTSEEANAKVVGGTGGARFGFNKTNDDDFCECAHFVWLEFRVRIRFLRVFVLPVAEDVCIWDEQSRPHRPELPTAPSK
jgi:hypothetical protein